MGLRVTYTTSWLLPHFLPKKKHWLHHAARKVMKQRGHSGSWHQASFKEKLVNVQVFMQVFQHNSKSIFYKQVSCFKTPFCLAEDNPKISVLYTFGFKICLFLILVHELQCGNTKKTTDSTYFSSSFCIVSVIANVLASSLLISSVLCLSELSHSCNIIYEWLIKSHNKELNN